MTTLMKKLTKWVKSPFTGWGLFTDFMKGKVVKELMIIVAVSLAAGILLSGCQGVITGHQYTDDEILKIASFSGESIDRVKFALKNPQDVNLTELAKSLERIDQAKKEIREIKK